MDRPYKLAISCDKGIKLKTNRYIFENVLGVYRIGKTKIYRVLNSLDSSVLIGFSCDITNLANVFRTSRISANSTLPEA